MDTSSLLKSKPKARPAAAPDPFAPYSPGAINQAINKYTAGMPKPLNDTQITSRAQGMLDPVIAALTSSINARAAAGQQAVTGYTDQLARSLATTGPAGAYAAYEPAKASAAASSSALADRLQGAGNQSADGLAARLASIEAPGAVDAAVNQARGNAAGASNASYANGNAALQGLISNEADAVAFANKMPGIAKLSGIQQSGAVQGRAVQDIADQTSQIQAQLPSIVTSLRNSSDQNASARAATGADIWKFLQGQNTTRAVAHAGLVGETTKANAAAAPHIDVTLSGKLGYLVDQYGAPVNGGAPLPGFTTDGNGTVVKAKPAAGTSGQKLQSKTVNGHVVTFDPKTGTYYEPGTTTVVNPNTLKKPAAPVSASKVQSAKTFVQQASKGYYAYQRQDSKPLSMTQLASLAKTAGEPLPQFLTDESALTNAGLGYYQHAQNEDAAIQQIYLTLIHDYGIPARRAFTIVGSTYKNWAKARQNDYFPKGT